MASSMVDVDVRVRDLPGLKLLVALIAMVSCEGAYQIERAPAETRGDWMARTKRHGIADSVNLAPLVRDRLQVKRGGRWVRL